MVQEFDLFAIISHLAKHCREAYGSTPTGVSISPSSYQSLVEFKALTRHRKPYHLFVTPEAFSHVQGEAKHRDR